MAKTIVQKHDRPEIFWELTRSICPECRKVIDARILLRDGKVFMRKRCPEHGQFEALIFGDAQLYTDIAPFNKPGTLPLEFVTEIRDGCPHDCGLCPDHQQHACLALIEVNQACNLDCPLCFANSGTHLSHSGWELIFTVGMANGTYRPLLVLSPLIAETIARSGLSKRDVQQWLFENARMPAQLFERYISGWTNLVPGRRSLNDLARLGKAPKAFAGNDPNRLVPIVLAPEHIMIAVAGDPLRSNCYLFVHNGMLGFPTTRTVRRTGISRGAPRSSQPPSQRVPRASSATIAAGNAPRLRG